jgi:hypothetical protein
MQIMRYVGCVVKFLKDKQLLQPPIIASVCVDANVSARNYKENTSAFCALTTLILLRNRFLQLALVLFQS